MLLPCLTGAAAMVQRGDNLPVLPLQPARLEGRAFPLMLQHGGCHAHYECHLQWPGVLAFLLGLVAVSFFPRQSCR